MDEQSDTHKITRRISEGVKELWERNSSHEIAVQLSISRRTVVSYVNRLGLQKRTRFESRSRFSTSVNKNFFKTWSAEMAYILGYTWADGCIGSTRGVLCRLQYDCQERDSDLLYKIRECIQSRHKIAHLPAEDRVDGIRAGPHARFYVVSPWLVSDLVELHGVLPRKSELDLPFPEVPEYFLSHFCRGYLDGDGSVSLYSTGNLAVRFNGSHRFMEGMQERMALTLGLPKNKLSQADVWGFGWSSRDDLRKIFHWLYHLGNPLYIHRKKDKLEKYVIYG